MIMTFDEDHLWTIQETSRYLGVPVGTLYQWRSAGRGPKSGRAGRHLRYRTEDVRAWFVAQTGREVA
jgi:excisionase family DNA binding protein